MRDLLAALRETLPYGRKITGLLPEVPLSASTTRLIIQVGDGRTELLIWKRSTERELHLYRHVLTPGEAGSPTLLGFRAHADSVWLFLEALPEHFPGLGGSQVVEQVYQHLADLHLRFASQPTPTLPGDSPWQISTAEIASALGAFPETAPFGPEAAALLSGGPFTLVQGDYHRWNLTLVQNRVRVLDWEHAAWAHPIWDLVLLAPEEAGHDSVPVGALAELALRTYHRRSLLSSLPWESFLRLQRLARLFVAARWAQKHARARSDAPPGPVAETIQTYENTERRRMARLSALLRGQ